MPLILLGIALGCVSPPSPFAERPLISAMRDSKELIAYRISSKNVVRTLAAEDRLQRLFGVSADAKMLLPPLSSFGKWTNVANQIQGQPRLS